MNQPITPEEEIFDDLHSGVTALHELVKDQPAGILSPRAVESLRRLENSVSTARSRLARWRQLIKDNATVAAKKTDLAVRHHPWGFALGSLVLGLVVGMLISGGNRKED
ncbi:MAG: hypothetical protein PHV34_18170 [Verrucomicrobiae bacterium]|nr:hypothetical protein [Verrucomicrobiae bacterium]